MDTMNPHQQERLEKPRTKFWLYLIPAFVFICLTTLSFIAYNYAKQTIEKQVQARFIDDTNVLQSAIANRFSIYLTAMYGVQGLFASSQSVSRQEFASYLNASDIQSRFPGLRGIGFLQYVTGQDKQVFIESVRSDRSATASGYPNFTIKPPGERAESYVLTYTANPITVATSAAFGFDYLTDPLRRDAILKAVDNNTPVASDVLTLLGTSPDNQGILVFLPIYKNNMPINTVAERKAAVYGAILGGFSGKELFNTIQVEQNIPQIHIEVYDSDSVQDISDKDKLYESAQDIGVEKFAQILPVRVGDRTLLIRFTAGPNYGLSNSEIYLPSGILVGGLLLSLFITITLYQLINSRSRALAIAERMTMRLTESEKQYRTIFETLQDVYFRTDMEGKILSVSPSITHFTDLPINQIIGSNVTTFYTDPQARDTLLSKLQETGAVSDYLLQLKGKSNQPISVSLTAHLILDEAKKSVGLEGIFRDATERIKFETEMQKRSEELERINKIMTDRELKMIELKKEIEELKTK